MRPSEIRKFSDLLKHITLSPNAVQEFSEGMEWSDIPFPNLKSVETERYPYRTGGDYLIFGKTPDKDPTWMELLILVDELVGRSGDTHHRYFEEFEYQDDRLKVGLGS